MTVTKHAPLPAEVLRHVVDVHCHPTDAPSISSLVMDNLDITICAMSTMQSDQQLVHKLASNYPQKVVPCFGYHPWFTFRVALQPWSSKEEHYRRLFLEASPPQAEHEEIFARLLPVLPEPITLEQVLDDVRCNFAAFPEAMLGEVGLDRSFRVPFDYLASRREMSPFTVPFYHQLIILEAQIDLAVELSRNISVHSVKAQSATTELLTRMAQKHGDKWSRISIDMHSCGLSTQTWSDIEKRHSNVFMSLSTVINSRSPNHRALIAACSQHRILIESDYNDVTMCTEMTCNMLQVVAEIKGWSIEDRWEENLEESEWGAVRRLEANWNAFQKGNHSPQHKKSKKVRKEESRLGGEVN